MHAYIQTAVTAYQPPPALVERVVGAEIHDSGLIPMKNHSRSAPVWIAGGFREQPAQTSHRLRMMGGAWILTGGNTKKVTYRAHRSRLPKMSARYVKLADQAGAHFHVAPALILAVIAQESRFNPRAESAAGAKGLMQLMPSTARNMGVRNPFNPRQSIWGGTRYLSRLLHHYRGNVRLALAAYNAGMTVVDAHGGRIPAYAETRAYVPEVVGNYLAIINSSNTADGS